MKSSVLIIVDAKEIGEKNNKIIVK